MRPDSGTVRPHTGHSTPLTVLTVFVRVLGGAGCGLLTGGSSLLARFSLVGFVADLPAECAVRTKEHGVCVGPCSCTNPSGSTRTLAPHVGHLIMTGMRSESRRPPFSASLYLKWGCEARRHECDQNPPGHVTPVVLQPADPADRPASDHLHRSSPL